MAVSNFLCRNPKLIGKSPEEYNSNLCFDTLGVVVALWRDSPAELPPFTSNLVMVDVDPIGHSSYP